MRTDTQTDRITDAQTDAAKRFTPSTVVGVSMVIRSSLTRLHVKNKVRKNDTRNFYILRVCFAIEIDLSFKSFHLHLYFCPNLKFPTGQLSSRASVSRGRLQSK